MEAVINGRRTTLERLLRENPELVRARSTRVTNFDPPVREATLLHYISANGVEEYRQKTPKNVVEVAKVCSVPPRSLMRWAAMYGGQRATMSMLVSSSHPAEARV